MTKNAMPTVQITLIFLFIIYAALTGCSSQSTQVNNADFKKLDNEYLCGIYGLRANQAEEARAELLRRGLFTEDQLREIDNAHLAVGMPGCATKAAYGDTVKNYLFNRDLKGNLVSTAIIFDCRNSRAPICPTTQVTIANGLITSVEAGPTGQ